MSIRVSKLLVISVLVSPMYLACHSCMHFPGNHERPPSIQECPGKSTNVLQTFGGWVVILKEAILGYSNILTGNRFSKQKERLLNKKEECKRLPGWPLHWIPGLCPQLPVKRNCFITKWYWAVPWPQIVLFNRFSHACSSLHNILGTSQQKKLMQECGKQTCCYILLALKLWKV